MSQQNIYKANELVLDEGKVIREDRISSSKNKNNLLNLID